MHSWCCLVQYSKGIQISDPDVARTALTVFWMLAEPVRLAAGYYGNLKENVGCMRMCSQHGIKLHNVLVCNVSCSSPIAQSCGVFAAMHVQWLRSQGRQYALGVLVSCGLAVGHHAAA